MAHYNIRPATVTLGHGFVDNTTVPGCPMPRLGSGVQHGGAWWHGGWSTGVWLPRAEMDIYLSI